MICGSYKLCLIVHVIRLVHLLVVSCAFILFPHSMQFYSIFRLSRLLEEIMSADKENKVLYGR